MRVLDDLVKAGKVRYVGVSNYSVPLLEQALAVRHVDSIQPPYNLFARDAEKELLPFSREHGVGVVCYSPLHSGLLGGRYTPDTTFDDGDWRAHNPDFTGEGLSRNVRRVDALKEIAARTGHTVAQLAVAWVLSNPAVTAAIVGVRRPDHITGVLPAADWDLDEDIRQEIEEVMARESATAVR
jgi:aryl-alcohol dehydrogenase-like predicted oxidoreductase